MTPGHEVVRLREALREIVRLADDGTLHDATYRVKSARAAEAALRDRAERKA